MIIRKTKKELALMDTANKIVAEVLEELRVRAKAGISTFELESIAEEQTKKRGAQPAFKGYRGYPCALCVSINDEIVHGIPSKKRFLKEGDIVSIDFGVSWKGYYGDRALTFPVGGVNGRHQELLETTRAALDVGIEKARVGTHLSNISSAIQQYVEPRGFSVIREFVGHGIGADLHEDPQLPNFGPPDTGPKLEEGMVLAIEPMVAEGSYDVIIDADGWTARTKDGSFSAHFEYSVALTGNGPWILGS